MNSLWIGGSHLAAGHRILGNDLFVSSTLPDNSVSSISREKNEKDNLNLYQPLAQITKRVFFDVSIVRSFDFDQREILRLECGLFGKVRTFHFIYHWNIPLISSNVGFTGSCRKDEDLLCEK